MTMCWPWKKHHHEVSPEAIRSLAQANLDLERARSQRSEAHEVSLELIAARRKNHFGEAFEQSIRRPPE